ncbi:hypothetical protein HDV01_004650 [Terramyces sp. JEL0728]|nr:hypothetical protein HDV01_004650 [Terramyces sp. JEL0728]
MALRFRTKAPHSVTEKIRREKIKRYMDQLKALVPANARQQNVQQLYVLENTVEYIIWVNKELEKQSVTRSQHTDIAGTPKRRSSFQGSIREYASGKLLFDYKAKMTAPKIKLTYFDLRGRGENIRVALSLANIPFEDERLTKEEFAERKSTFPFHQLPCLTVDGQVYCQSVSILRYIGKIGNLYPEDPLLALKVDAIVDFTEDIRNVAAPSFKETDDAKRLAMREGYVQNEFPKMFGALESYVESDQFCVGNSTTVADIAVSYLVSMMTVGFLSGVPKTVLDGYPKLLGIKNRFNQLPEYLAWENRSKK